jgi:hypothetical protein
MKPDDITITQITHNDNTIYGLGSDQKIYQWNMLDGSWRVYSQKDREKLAAEAHSTPAPTPPVV